MNQEQLATKLAYIKDVSEMMVDLAYSSLIYGSEDIADQVLEMEAKVDNLHTDLELAVLELKETRPVKGLLGLIRLALASEELADAAATIAHIVKRGVQAHPIMKMAMEDAEETIMATRIAEDSVLCGKTLGEAGLEDDIGMRIIAMRKGDDWIYNPPDSTPLNPGDITVAKGYIEGREKLLTLADPNHIHD
jgi:uncharacterized protein with PhoU and TrkA domain